MTDRDFWLLVRSALLMIVKAIEQKFSLKPKYDAKWVEEHLKTEGETIKE